MHYSPRAVVPALLLALLLAACAQSAPPSRVPATASVHMPTLLLTKSPTCTCCSEHEAYLRQAGMQVQTAMNNDMNAVKDALNIPAEMRSCHTSTLGRFFVEGHVPMAAIEQLVREAPDIDGIALPGMPPGAPGMTGQLEGPLVVYAIADGVVIGEFGRY